MQYAISSKTINSSYIDNYIKSIKHSNIISEHTFEKVQKDSDRDYWMTSEEAKLN